MNLTLPFFLTLILYCYFGYPLCIGILARLRERRVKKQDYTPFISVVISVWNEEDVIARKIENLLALDYPSSEIEVLIGSDCSSDRTDEIIRQYQDARIRFYQSTDRQGKMAMLNRLVKEARGEVIVFTDARQVFESGAVRELVNNFSDPDVGCVSGELMFSEKEGGTAKGINLYWKYEKWIRSQESKVHSMLGATGAICALRRSLYQDVPASVVLDDMFIPFHAILKGYRAVFDESARAYDEVADNPQEEHNRKARTLFGNYQIFALMPQMFNPFRSPVALQLFSHKFLRLMVPFLMIGIFLITVASVNQPCYREFFILQVVFYLMALCGSLAKKKKYGILSILKKVCYIPYVFCLLNLSALSGFWRFVTGGQRVTWEKAREAGVSD